jgi:hypothetical protein
MSSEIGMRPRWRELLFKAGWIATALSVVGVIGCWNPVPLLPSGQGGYRTNPWDEVMFLGSVSTSLLTVILAFFGRGLPRTVLILIGLLLLVLSTVGFVSSHV